MENPFELMNNQTARRFNIMAIGGLVFIFVTEWLTPHFSIAPPLALLVISILALKLKTRVLCAWVLVYTVFTASMLYWDRVNWPLEGRHLRFLIRFSTIIVGNGIAIGLSIYRSRLEASYLQMLGIFKKIPAALIVSNNIGNIIAVNEECSRIAGIDSSEMVGDSYFKYFGIGSSKGESVRRYLELIENPSLEPEAINIRILPHNLQLSGTLVTLQMQGSGGETCILTTLNAETTQEFDQFQNAALSTQT